MPRLRKHAFNGYQEGKEEREQEEFCTGMHIALHSPSERGRYYTTKFMPGNTGASGVSGRAIQRGKDLASDIYVHNAISVLAHMYPDKQVFRLFPSLNFFSHRDPCVAAFAEVLPCHRYDLSSSGFPNMTWLFLPKPGIEGYFLPKRLWRCEDWRVSVGRKKKSIVQHEYFSNGENERLHKLHRRTERQRTL